MGNDYACSGAYLFCMPPGGTARHMVISQGFIVAMNLSFSSPIGLKECSCVATLAFSVLHHTSRRLWFLKSLDKIFWGSFATCFPSLYKVATVKVREQHWKDLSSHAAWLFLRLSCPEKKKKSAAGRCHGVASCLPFHFALCGQMSLVFFFLR